MPGPSVSPPPPPPPLPPLPAPDITPAAEQRLSSVRSLHIDAAVPRELLSVVHAFASQHKLVPSPQPCGHCFVVFSHLVTLDQLVALHRRVASLAAVTLLPSSLFLSTPSVPSSPPAASPPTRPVLLAFLSLFAHWRVSCSNLPADEKALLAHLTVSLSGYYGKDFDLTYTHLLTSSSRSDKYAACQRMADPTCTAVLPAYLARCYKSASLHTPTAAECQRLLTGMRLCVTGIEAQERNTIMRLIQAEGGEYSANLTKTCTHLIAHKPEGEKYNAAVLWGLHIVGRAWLVRVVKDRRLEPEKDWPVGRTTDEGHDVDKAAGEERKEAAEMEVDRDDSKQPELDDGSSSGRVNGHRRPAEDHDDEEEKNGVRQEKGKEEDEHKESGRTALTTTAAHQNGGDTAGWKKKPKKATKEQKAEEDDSLKTIPLPDRTQSPRPHSPAAPAPAPTALGAAALASPLSAAAAAVDGSSDGDDSYLDAVQVLLCLPSSSSSSLFLRSVALIRAGGGTRLSSYRPTLTHIVSTDVALVQSMLRFDRLSLLPSTTITTSTATAFASTLPTPIVSPQWLEASHTAKRPLPASHYQLVAADEPVASVPAMVSRQSSVVRQRVVSEFAAFNESIVRGKADGTSGAGPLKRRRRTRSSASGMFAGKLFVFEGLDLKEQEELLLSVRREGGDVLAADETEEDVHIVVAQYWTADLPTKYQHATFVTPNYITDRLNNPATTPSNTYTTLSHTPLPQHTTTPSPVIPAFQHHTFALTGYPAAEQQQLKRLLAHLGARAITDGMRVGHTTHLLCKEGAAGVGRKWELAWGGVWKGRVVRLRWLVECLRQGREVPLAAEMVWRKEDVDADPQDKRERVEVAEVNPAVADKRVANAGKRAVAQATNADASASPAIDVDMQVEAPQPPPQHPSEQQNGREADEEDLDKTEQDSTAEHMDTEPHNPTPAPHTNPPPATHDTADEQADILAPLPPPSPTSSHSSPFPTRYGRTQQPHRTNRVYTPPKTPSSATTPPPAAQPVGGGEGGRGRRRRLAVEDRAGGAVVGGAGEDVFGFQGADEAGQDERKNHDDRGKGKVAATASAKDKGEAHRKRIQEDEEEANERSQQSRQGQAKEAAAVKPKGTATAVGHASTSDKTAAVNGKRDAKKLLEHELEQLDEAEEADEQQQRKGRKTATVRHDGGEEDDTAGKSEAPRSRLPGRKRLNTAQRKEDEDEEDEAEYEPPAAAAAAENEAVKEKAAKAVATQPFPSEKNRSSKIAAKAQKAAAPAAMPDKPVDEQKAQPTPARKGRARAKQSVTPPSTSGDEEKEGQEEGNEKQASSANGRPASAGKKSARAQRKEELKAKDAVSPAKPRPSRRTAAPHDDEADSVSVTDSDRPVRSTRKRSAPQPDDVIAVDSDESSSSSSAKRARASEGAAAATATTDNKYRFAIASRGSMSAEKAAALREMIEKLGAECIDDGDDYSLCSAVVIKDHTQLKRTEKVLAAIVSGLPIVPRSYIEASSEKGDFLQPSNYRFRKDDMDDTGRVLLRAAARWKHKRPFKGWAVCIADSKRARMLTAILSMGGGRREEEQASDCTHCLVDVKEGGVEAAMKRMWNAGVPVYRSELVVECICYGDTKDWPDWDVDAFKLTKDNWKQPWTNPWKGEVPGSQSTHGTEGVETDGKRKRRH